MDSERETLETSPTVLVFSAGRLSIENPFTVESSRSAETSASLQDLIGASVLEAFSTDEELVLVFTVGHRISISLRGEDFTCPEAASYAPDHGPIVVFN